MSCGWINEKWLWESWKNCVMEKKSLLSDTKTTHQWEIVDESRKDDMVDGIISILKICVFVCCLILIRMGKNYPSIRRVFERL